MENNETRIQKIINEQNNKIVELGKQIELLQNELLDSQKNYNRLLQLIDTGY
jgi:hypothetical protein